MAKTDSKELKDLWVTWTREAISKYSLEIDEDAEDEEIEDAIDDMVDISTKYADSMLDEYEARFGSSSGARRRRRKKDEEDPD